jgi:hypothetical protein
MKKLIFLFAFAISLINSGQLYAITLKPEQAFANYINLYPLNFELHPKLLDDHFIIDEKPVSHANLCKDKALDRYKKNKNKISSWVVLTEDKLKNKIRESNDKKAYIHENTQQVSVKIKVEQYTTTILELKGDEKGAEKIIDKFQDINGTKYLKCYGEKTDNNIYLTGEWNPLTGKVILYHYDANPGEKYKEHKMLAKYLNWLENSEGKPTMPAAKK